MPGSKIYEKQVTLSGGSKKTLEIFDDKIVGYNEKGKECVQVDVEEPMFERSRDHFNSI